MIELNKTYKRRVNSNIFRYATVIQIDLMNNCVSYIAVDKNINDREIGRCERGIGIKAFEEAYLQND